MTNKQFEIFLEKSIKSNSHKCFEYSCELDKPHEFSKEFEAKMKKLIQKRK